MTLCVGDSTAWRFRFQGGVEGGLEEFGCVGSANWVRAGEDLRSVQGLKLVLLRVCV